MPGPHSSPHPSAQPDPPGTPTQSLHPLLPPAICARTQPHPIPLLIGFPPPYTPPPLLSVKWGRNPISTLQPTLAPPTRLTSWRLLHGAAGCPHAPGPGCPLAAGITGCTCVDCWWVGIRPPGQAGHRASDLPQCRPVSRSLFQPSFWEPKEPGDGRAAFVFLCLGLAKATRPPHNILGGILPWPQTKPCGVPWPPHSGSHHTEPHSHGTPPACPPPSVSCVDSSP